MKMTRAELIKSREYWIGEIQQELFELIEEYLEMNNLTRNQFAEKLNVTKGYVSQILNGDYDHRLSKFIDLALAIDKVPRVKFIDLEEIIKQDELGYLNENLYEYIDIKLNLGENLGVSNYQNIDLKNTTNSDDDFLSNEHFTHINFENADEYETA
ncbi:MAG: helix-turn-helix transcriptional regulator [Ignavibacteria bacterium]|nr:helix-turn-helix transcriptional regulator [Ignavibacteria bacterium]